VIYRGSNGHLHEVAWTTGDAAHTNLTTATPAQPSAGRAKCCQPQRSHGLRRQSLPRMVDRIACRRRKPHCSAVAPPRRSPRARSLCDAGDEHRPRTGLRATLRQNAASPPRARRQALTRRRLYWYLYLSALERWMRTCTLAAQKNMSCLTRTVFSSGLFLASLVLPVSASQADRSEAGVRFTAAIATQTVGRAKLGVLGDAFTCPDARLVAYRRSTAEPDIADQWYVASQLWADAALLLATDRVRMGATAGSDILPQNWDPQDTRCHVDKGFSFLDRLWDYTSAGYFPHSNPVGTAVDTVTARYGDDNSVGGLALLVAAEMTNEPAARQRYIHAAQREADFLRQSTLWDEVFGGGFWWNTGRGDSAEGKPAQTNALAALFFARLYAETNNPEDRAWALRTLLWMDTVLYDPGRHLYHWSVSYSDLPRRTGALITPRFFNYDQGLAIQAQLAAFRLDHDAARPQRARDVGGAVMTAFWSDELGSFNLEAGIQQVYTGFSAWTSFGHLALYELDGDAEWLARARANANALSARLRAPDGGYGMRSYVCVNTLARGCESGQAHIVVDHTLDGAALAWAQHLETALADRLAARPSQTD
jgi:Glycosyl hydrolase family 76